MEQQTVTIKNFLRIIYPDIHLRRMTYPPERVLFKNSTDYHGSMIMENDVPSLLYENLHNNKEEKQPKSCIIRIV